MTPHTRAASLAALGWITLMSSGCLPGDERPEPGSLQLNVQRAELVQEGFATDDGWAISFDRFVAALGGEPLRTPDGHRFDDGCVDYSLSAYDRLYDFKVADTSKLVLHYGLGHCSVGFDLRQPSPTTILMAGVSEADRDFMSPPDEGLFGDDHHHDDPLGIALVVVGRARKDGVNKEFRWRFRSAHSVRKCHAPDSEVVVNEVDLYGGDALVRELQIRPRELFRLTPSLEAPIGFGQYAAADADGDGEVTLDELGKVEVPFEPILEALLDELPEDVRDEIDLADFVDPTLFTLVHDILTARVAAFVGAGECEVRSLF